MKFGKLLASPITQALITLALSQLQEVVTKAAARAARREEQRQVPGFASTDLENRA